MTLATKASFAWLASIALALVVGALLGNGFCIAVVALVGAVVFLVLTVMAIARTCDYLSGGE